ncbi:hypothetical protein TeGR_g12059, partial [Tetraparma gracilis]
MKGPGRPQKEAHSLTAPGRVPGQSGSAPAPAQESSQAPAPSASLLAAVRAEVRAWSLDVSSARPVLSASSARAAHSELYLPEELYSSRHGVAALSEEFGDVQVYTPHVITMASEAHRGSVSDVNSRSTALQLQIRSLRAAVRDFHAGRAGGRAGLEAGLEGASRALNNAAVARKQSRRSSDVLASTVKLALGHVGKRKEAQPAEGAGEGPERKKSRGKGKKPSADAQGGDAQGGDAQGGDAQDPSQDPPQDPPAASAVDSAADSAAAEALGLDAAGNFRRKSAMAEYRDTIAASSGAREESSSSSSEQSSGNFSDVASDDDVAADGSLAGSFAEGPGAGLLLNARQAAARLDPGASPASSRARSFMATPQKLVRMVKKEERAVRRTRISMIKKKEEEDQRQGIVTPKAAPRKVAPWSMTIDQQKNIGWFRSLARSTADKCMFSTVMHVSDLSRSVVVNRATTQAEKHEEEKTNGRRRSLALVREVQSTSSAAAELSREKMELQKELNLAIKRYTTQATKMEMEAEKLRKQGVAEREAFAEKERLFEKEKKDTVELFISRQDDYKMEVMRSMIKMEERLGAERAKLDKVLKSCKFIKEGIARKTKEAASLTEERDKLRHEKMGLEQDVVNAVRRGEEEAGRLRGELEEARRRHAEEMGAAAEKHGEEVRAMSDKHGEEKKLQDNTVATLKEVQQSTLKEHAELSAKHQELTTKHGDLGAKHEELGARHRGLSEQHEDLSTKHKSLSEQHEGKVGEHERLERKHRELEDEAEKRTKELEEKLREIEAKAAEKHEALEDHKQKSIAMQEGLLSEKAEAVRAVEAEFGAVVSKKEEELLGFRTEAERNLDELRKALELKDKEIEEMRAAKEGKEAEVENMEAEVSALKDKIANQSAKDQEKVVEMQGGIDEAKEVQALAGSAAAAEEAVEKVEDEQELLKASEYERARTHTVGNGLTMPADIASSMAQAADAGRGGGEGGE